MGYIHPLLERFSYFDIQLDKPDWPNKRVLDFGGNWGNLLRDPASKIDPQLYWCLEVDQLPLEKGNTDFPEAHWIYYNRHNPCYNPSGIKNAPLPELNETFDFIISFSVFTHMPEEEMHELIPQLMKRLRPGGSLAFTFLEPLAISYFLIKRMKNGATLDLPATIQWVLGKEKFYMINDGDLQQEADAVERCQHFLSFYDKNYLLGTLKEHSPVYRPPVHHEIQSCLILKHA